MFAPKVNKLAANFTFGIPSFDISKILFTFVVNHPNWFKQMQTLLKQMKYLRSLMQQFVTACKNQAKLIQQFTLSLLYLFIIHIVALLFFFLFRLVLFTSIDYQFLQFYLYKFIIWPVYCQNIPPNMLKKYYKNYNFFIPVKYLPAALWYQRKKQPSYSFLWWLLHIQFYHI